MGRVRALHESVQAAGRGIRAGGAPRHNRATDEAVAVDGSEGTPHSPLITTPLVHGLTFAESYAYLDDWVLAALGDMGINAWYKPLNDIATDAGKIAGAAQKRIVAGSGAVLHHVTMSYDIDAGKMVEVLRIGKEKLSDKGTTSAKKRVDPLRRRTGLPRAQVIDRMITSFRTRYGGTDATVTAQEFTRARELATTKFSSAEWTTRVP